jgi:hypothetical protein
MESKNYLQNGVNELTNEDLFLINGGSFGYDLGFFIRELVIYTVNGGNGSGTIAVAVDLGLNYKPVH